jgi:endonuclease-3
MPAITNKQQLLNQAYTALKKKYPLTPPRTDPRPVLEELIYAILREGTTREDADRAYDALRKSFIDWNEIRVSTVQEVADVIRPLPGAGLRAGWIIAVLMAVFEMSYSYDLDELGKKGLKQAARQLGRYFDPKDLEKLDLKQAAKQVAKQSTRFKNVNDYAVAWVIQRTFGGHAIPLDGPTLRVLQRLGVVEDAEPESLESLRGSIEHVIPKARGPEFTELMSVHAKETCVEGTPHCPACPLKADCPAGQQFLAAKKSETKAKPHKSR